MPGTEIHIRLIVREKGFLEFTGVTGAFDFWREPDVDADIVNPSLRSNSMATCFDYFRDCSMPLRLASLSKLQSCAAGV